MSRARIGECVLNAGGNGCCSAVDDADRLSFHPVYLMSSVLEAGTFFNVEI